MRELQSKIKLHLFPDTVSVFDSVSEEQRQGLSALYTHKSNPLKLFVIF